MLVPRTVHTKCFEEQVAGTCPDISNWFEFMGLIARTTVALLDFEAKMVSSHEKYSRITVMSLYFDSSVREERL